MLSKETTDLIKIGLIQGLPLALLLGTYHILLVYCRKQQQRRYVRNIVHGSLEKLLTLEDKEYPPLGMIKGDHIRRTIYDDMQRQIDSFFRHKTTDQISYEEESKIRNPFNVINWATGESKKKAKKGEDIMLTVEICRNVLVKELKEIDWLKLDKY